jgi:hypothetical protein
LTIQLSGSIEVLTEVEAELWLSPRTEEPNSKPQAETILKEKHWNVFIFDFKTALPS